MKRLYCIKPVMLLVTMALPVFCMDKNFQDTVNFEVEDGIVPIQKSHLPLIKTLDEHYCRYIEKKHTLGKVIPLFKPFTKKQLLLVNDALRVRPDKFREHYGDLSPQNKVCLITLSGHYDESGTQLMLNVPDVTKRLIEVCLPSDVRSNINRFIKDKDEDFVRNYCKRKLLTSGFLSTAIKRPIAQSQTIYENWVYDSIPFNSLFVNGYWTHNQPLSPIPLFINDKVYQTFSYNFITDDCELRITDTKSSITSFALSQECLLWVVNHDNSDLTYATKIQHNDLIKGCCFSKTGTGTEYVVTYSEKDLVFTKIIMEPDRLPVISSIHSPIANNGTIVHVGFNHATNQVAVVTHKKYKSLFTSWNMDGACGPSGEWAQKTYGFAELVFFGKSNKYGAMRDFVAYVLNGMGMYALYVHDISANPQIVLYSRCDSLYNLRNWIDQRGDTTFIYDTSCSPFDVIIQAEKKGIQGGLLEKFKNYVGIEPDNQSFKTYSPDGTLLMCNSLKKKLGFLYVETCIKDAKNHQPIMSIDTLYQNCAGVGVNDQLELVFFNHTGPNEKVFLWNNDDKQIIEEFEALACKNSGVASVIKRLCQECDARGYIVLSDDDPLRAILIDWSRRSPAMLAFLKKCLPFNK